MADEYDAWEDNYANDVFDLYQEDSPCGQIGKERKRLIRTSPILQDLWTHPARKYGRDDRQCIRTTSWRKLWLGEGDEHGADFAMGVIPWVIRHTNIVSTSPENARWGYGWKRMVYAKVLQSSKCCSWEQMHKDGKFLKATRRANGQLKHGSNDREKGRGSNKGGK